VDYILIDHQMVLKYIFLIEYYRNILDILNLDFVQFPKQHNLYSHHIVEMVEEEVEDTLMCKMEQKYIFCYLHHKMVQGIEIGDLYKFPKQHSLHKLNKLENMQEC
jgi:hypothetical protein